MSQSTPIREWMREITEAAKMAVPYRKLSPRIRPAIARTNRRKSKRLLRKFTWDAADNMFNLKEIMSNTTDNKIFLGVSDVEDLITSEIMQRRIDAGKTTVQRDTTVLCNRERWATWAEEHYADFLYTQNNTSSGMIIEEETQNFIKFDVNSNSTSVRAFGDVEFAMEQIAIIEENFDVVTSYIESDTNKN